MRTNYEFTLCEGYLLNKKNGKLEEYKPISITFDTEKEIVVYRGLFWSGERIVTESEFELYASIQDYEQGKKVSMRDYTLRDIFRPFCCVQIVGDKALAWKFINRQAMYSDVLGYSITYEVRNGHLHNESAYIREGIRLYQSREEAIYMNDTVIVDKDGNEKVRTGLGKALKLNEEQMAAVKKFEEAWSALGKLGVDVFINTDTYEVFCSNKVENVDFDWCGGDAYAQVDKEFTPLKVQPTHTFSCEGLWMRYID